jgi:hypothetical protein
MDEYNCEEDIGDILLEEDSRKKYNSDTNTLENYKFLLDSKYLNNEHKDDIVKHLFNNKHPISPGCLEKIGQVILSVTVYKGKSIDSIIYAISKEGLNENKKIVFYKELFKEYLGTEPKIPEIQNKKRKLFKEYLGTEPKIPNPNKKRKF